MVKVRVTIDLEYEETHGMEADEVAATVELLLDGVGEGMLSLGDHFEQDYEVTNLQAEVTEDTEPASEMAATLATICKR